MQNLSKKFFKRTKIVSTFGPAITSDILSLKDLEDPSKKEVVAEVYDRVQKLIESGMNCARLNFSHGTHEEQLVRIKIIRDVAAKLKKNIAIMLDTKGPEIRLGKFNQKKVEVRINTQVDVYTVNDVIGDSNHFSVKATSDGYNMINDVKVGSSILVDDGKLKLVVTNIDKEANIIHTISENSHEISEKKRINLPDANYTMPFLSDKDKEDIKFACDNKLDFIALSFVNSADNVREVREILVQNNFQNIQLISKIETKNAINKLDEIIAASDGIMVARGDLGLEIPYYEVPY
jgi:pyruvate kinase